MAVPKSTDKPIMGLVSDKNFIVSNAVENILAAPKLPENKEKDYLKKKNYGKVPKYLQNIKKEIEDESARQQQREIKLKEQTENLKRRVKLRILVKRVEKAEAKLVVSQKMKERAALKRVIMAQKLEQKKKLNKRKKARAIKRTAELENERLRQELESMRRTMLKQTEQQRKVKRRKKST